MSFRSCGALCCCFTILVSSSSSTVVEAAGAGLAVVSVPHRRSSGLKVAAVAVDKKIRDSLSSKLLALEKQTGQSSVEIKQRLQKAGCGKENAGCTTLCKGNQMCYEECASIQGMLCPTPPSGSNGVPGVVATTVGSDTTSAAAYAAYAAADSVKDAIRQGIRDVGEEGVKAAQAAARVAIKSMKKIEKKVIGRGTSNIAHAAATAAAARVVKEENVNVRTIAATSATSAIAAEKHRMEAEEEASKPSAPAAAY